MDRVRNLCFDLDRTICDLEESASVCAAARLFLQSREIEAEELLKELLGHDLPQEEKQACGDLLLALLISQDRFLDLGPFGFPRNAEDELMIRLYSPPPEIRFAASACVQKMPDAPVGNLPMVSVRINGLLADLLFDTGAMFTVISRSLAENCGVNKTRQTLKAAGNTGDAVDTQFAMISKLHAFNSDFLNIGAMILPDEALNFGIDESGKQLSFDGFLGWNVLKDLKWTVDMKERTVSAEKSEQTRCERNMCWDYYPMVRIQSEGKQMVFCFDTGNTETCLGDGMKPHFKLLDTRTDSTVGVGGMKQEEINVADKFLFTVCGRCASLNEVPIMNREFSFSRFFNAPGVLGSDIAKEKVMVIDYPNRHFEFK